MIGKNTQLILKKNGMITLIKNLIEENKVFWFYNKSVATYLTGTHYMYLQWSKIDVGKPDFREANRLFFIFWEACKADVRCYGMCYLKNRRSGFSFMASGEVVNLATINSIHDTEYCPNLGPTRRQCSLIKSYQYRSIIRSFLNRYKTEWTVPKPNLPIEYQRPNSPGGNSSPTRPRPILRDSIPLSIGKTRATMPMMGRNSNSSSTMNPVNGRGRTTSSTTGVLRKPPLD